MPCSSAWRRDDLDPSFKMLTRITHVQTQLTAIWDVLATMTPSGLLGIPQSSRALFGFSVAAVPAFSNFASATRMPK